MAIINHIRRSLMIIFALFYLYNYFIKNSQLEITLAIIIMVIIMLCILQLPRMNLVICSALFIIGILLLSYNNVPFKMWLLAVNKNAGLATMLITIHLLGLPFLNDNYQNELKHFAQKYMTNVFRFSILVNITSHIIGACVNLGSLPITYRLFADNAKLYKSEKIFISSLMHGYIGAGFWAPAWASMAVVDLELSINWLSIVPIGVVISLVFTVCSLLWNYIDFKRHADIYADITTDQAVEIKWSDLRALIVLTLSIIISIIIIDHALHWEIFITVALVAIVFPIISSLLLGRINKYKNDMLDYYNINLLRVKNEVLLFIAAGFFGKSLELSGVIKQLPGILPAWFSEYALISIFFIMALMMLVSIVGIHPIVSSTAIVTTLNINIVGLTPSAYAITIIIGFALATMISPFSGASLIISGLSGVHPWKLALKNNGIFTVAILIFMTIFIKILLGV